MSDGALRAQLSSLLSTTITDEPAVRVHGGNIHQCFRYRSSKSAVFVKVGPIDRRSVFEAEADALEEIRATQTVRVPSVIGVGNTEHEAFIALEWIDLVASTPSTDARLGSKLAQMHRAKKPLYGWKRSNFIGANPQANLWSRDWVHFWRTHRIDVQLDLATLKGADARFAERAALLSALMDGFFTSYIPDASLLHGDLWDGNRGVDSSGRPVIFDPACYYGDRECDLAMTKLFGGFSPEFYAAYQHEWPLDEGWQYRVDLYNLYHVLNHFNLFGGSYLQQADNMVNKLLAETGH